MCHTLHVTNDAVTFLNLVSSSPGVFIVEEKSDVTFVGGFLEVVSAEEEEAFFTS